MGVLHAPADAQPEEAGDAVPPEEQPPPEDPPPPAEEPEPTTGTVGGVVDSPELEAPLAGATVSVIGTSKTTVTDDVGNFSLELDPGKYVLRFELAGFQPIQKTVNVSAGASISLDVSLVAGESASAQEEVIVVVGSRTARTSLGTTVPVDVLTAEQIGRVGKTETGRILHTLAPSFNSTPQTIADGTDHVDPASLRGLGPDQMLVLVNGKRRHRSALIHLNGTFGRGTVGTDLNAIPTASIKRIEILRDGAASQYGSDAIAGVINIVTKDTVDQVELTQLTGITAKGDGAQVMTSANYGFKLGDDGFVNLTGQFLSRGATNRSGVYSGTIYSADGTDDQEILDDRGLTREDDFAMKIGEAAATVGMGAFNLELPTKNGAEFYAFGDLTYRNGTASGFFRFPKQESQNVPAFYPNGFLPLIKTNISDAAITTGWRRKSEVWDLDLSLSHGRNSFRFNIEESVNASLGTASPTTFDAGRLSFEQTAGNIDAVRRLPVEQVKSISLVAGAEFRVENYAIEAGDEASYSLGDETFGVPPQPKLPGAQVFPGFQPSNEVDRTRNSVGVYLGFESELTKRVTVDVGGRFEQYSDFGNSLIGKVAARVEPVDGFALRAAGSTGFRAPSLHQLWFSNVSTQFVPDAGGTLQPAQVLTSNNQSPITRAFAIPELNEEKSINVSGGFALRPTDHLSITADGYYIQLRDRIVLTSQFTNANPIVAEILSPFPGVSQAQFFANAIDTSTKGVDVVIDYDWELGESGRLTTTASANVAFTKVTDINIPRSLRNRFASDPAQLETFFFGRLAENRVEDALPRQKGTASVRYALKSFGALVRANYYGGVRFEPDNPANDEEFAAKVLFDLSFDVLLGKRARLTIGADNVFDTYPDKQVNAANISDGRFLYSRNVSQFGTNGGFYYTKLELTL